jgi:hypothetical protein
MLHAITWVAGALETVNNWIKLLVVAAKAGGGPAVKRTTRMVWVPVGAASAGTYKPQIVKLVGAVK